MAAFIKEYPVNINIKMKEPESSKEDKDNKIDDASKSEKPKDEEKSAAPAEDLTPPIQVRR